MPHAVLLGDSIFDNGPYVAPGSAVIDHLRQILPSDWDATLLATDGATTTAALTQVERIPDTATHLVLSAGGNDALWISGNLYPETTIDIREAMEKLGEQRIEFASNYRRLIAKLKSTKLQLTICTVYDSVPGLELSELTGLCVFNDTITRIAFENRLPLIDLRVICNLKSDYSDISPIEPSSSGGLKIARAVSAAVQGNDPLIVG